MRTHWIALTVLCFGCADESPLDASEPTDTSSTGTPTPTAPIGMSSGGNQAPAEAAESPSATQEPISEAPAPSASNGPSADPLPTQEPASPEPTATAPEPAPAEPEAGQPAVEGTPAEPAPSEEIPSNQEALDGLAEYLGQPVDARGPLGDEDFALAPLARADAEQAAEMLWQDKAATLREERSAEHEARSIALGELTLRYDFTVFGDEPDDGHSLFLSLHGGGNAEPSVNDQQWENQKQLYQPDEGIYLSPRAPTDTWNLWHESHIDPMFERLITNFIVLENVNPNRVYVMGYSAGGDGVYQLGPRMADHWAAASAMAGHPNEAQPLSLRNIGFTIHVGELDTAYDRNLVAVEWEEQLIALQQDDPEGYVHVVEVHPGKPHWMDLEDAVAVPWMAEFTRNPTPQKVVWYQDDITHQRFYWLAVPEARGETTVRAEIDGQTITVSSDDVSQVLVRLRDDMLDLDQPVAIVANGSEVYSGVVERTIATLARTLDEREDPAMVFSGEVLAEL